MYTQEGPGAPCDVRTTRLEQETSPSIGDEQSEPDAVEPPRVIRPLQVGFLGHSLFGGRFEPCRLRQSDSASNNRERRAPLSARGPSEGQGT